MSESFLDDSPFSSQKMMNFFHDNDQEYTNVAEFKVKSKKRKIMTKNSLPSTACFPLSSSSSSSLSCHIIAGNNTNEGIINNKYSNNINNNNSSKLMFVDEQSPIVTNFYSDFL